jgi:hypothetical protein
MQVLQRALLAQRDILHRLFFRILLPTHLFYMALPYVPHALTGRTSTATKPHPAPCALLEPITPQWEQLLPLHVWHVLQERIRPTMVLPFVCSAQ